MDERFAPSIFFALAEYKFAEIFTATPAWRIFPAGIARYLAMRYDLQKNHIAGEVSPAAWLDGTGIVIEAGARVEAGAFIRGPCLISTGCEVRHGAYVRGNVIAGKRCVIGHATEIKNSLLMNEVKAGHFAYIGDSILGNEVNLGAGVKLANLKLDPTKTVRIYGDGEIVDTKLRKFGAILGDRVQIGCNSVTNPGTVLAQDSFVHPCVTVSGAHLQAGSRITP